MIVLVGVNHKTAPVEIRERLALSPGAENGALEAFSSYVNHGVILHTCNRTELYVKVGHAGSGSKNVYRFLDDYFGLSSEAISAHLYTYPQEEAVRHLFRVASGLDSMIVGEYEILGQVREAMEHAHEVDFLDSVLLTLFRQALRVGRRAREETAIGRNAVSISSAGVELARTTLGGLEGRRVLVIGAGEAGRLAAQALAARGVSDVVVTNRTYERAQDLAQLLGAEAQPFEALKEALVRADIVISATGSPTPILTGDEVKQVMISRGERPLLVIDLAVPRDVEPEVARLPGVSLFDIDDLQAITDANLHLREQEVSKVEVIIEAEVERFMVWRHSLEVVPTIAALRAKAEEIRQQELARTLAKLSHLSEEERSRVEAMSLAIVKKMLHHPIVSLKENGTGSRYVKALRELFRLTTDEIERAGGVLGQPED